LEAIKKFDGALHPSHKPRRLRNLKGCASGAKYLLADGVIELFWWYTGLDQLAEYVVT
jgi:hypothetical protein